MLHEMMPHGQCILWDESILAREVIGNALTALAYFLIPLALFCLRKKLPLANHKLRFGLFLFVLFIVMCGAGHIIDIVSIWKPIYSYESWWKIATGVVSMFTAALILPELTARLK